MKGLVNVLIIRDMIAPHGLCDQWNSICTQQKNAKTPTEKTELQRTLGVGWSSLCRLPYFNIVKCHLVDPMHNMYLRTAKHMVKVWKEKGLIKQEHLHLIQVKIDELQVPYGVGRIPYKVGSNFAGLTADQWMNWTNLYSIHALADILPPKDLECWSFFVQASVLLILTKLMKSY